MSNAVTLYSFKTTSELNTGTNTVLHMFIFSSNSMFLLVIDIFVT
jgi:hypothetical protein